MIRDMLRKWIIGPEIEELKRLRIQLVNEISEMTEANDKTNTNIIDVIDDNMKNNKLIIDTINNTEEVLKHNKLYLKDLDNKNSEIQFLRNLCSKLSESNTQESTTIDSREVIELALVRLKPNLRDITLLKLREDIIIEYCSKHNIEYIEDNKLRIRK